MTPTEVKKAADQMVGVFGPYMAIEHCKRVIEELEEITFSRYDNHARSSIENRINHYRLILSELEGRVK